MGVFMAHSAETSVMVLISLLMVMVCHFSFHCKVRALKL